jgi:hypothetical protein
MLFVIVNILKCDVFESFGLTVFMNNNRLKVQRSNIVGRSTNYKMIYAITVQLYNSLALHSVLDKGVTRKNTGNAPCNWTDF